MSTPPPPARRELVLTRDLKREDGKLGTFGELDTGTLKVKILERPKPGLVDDHPCVPATDRGYDMDWTEGVHPKHPECYEVKVPGRTAILFHKANVFEQLLGCFAPGLEIGQAVVEWDGQTIEHVGVLESKTALERLLADLKKQPCRLIIKETT